MKKKQTTGVVDMNALVEIQTQLFDKNQTAKYLGLKSAQTLDNWRCTKRYPLPYVRVGRAIRYRRADLDAFIASRTVTPTEVSI